MRYQRSQKLAVACACILGIAASAAFAQDAASSKKQDTAALEEVVVTGSYIKHDKFDLASPVEVVGGTELQTTGKASIGQYIRDLTYTSNVDTVANVLDTADGLQSSDSPQFNLRGLGTSSTLTLYDGRRTLNSGSVNGIIPDIAVQRVEILLDGGSALYGTDAVAGVVNFIPIKKYSGVKATALYNTDQHSDYHQTKFSVLGGRSFGDFDLVGAVAYAKQSPLYRSARPKFLAADTDESTSGNPGSFRRPAGVNPQTALVDPTCGTYNGTATDDSKAGAFPSGHPLGTFCLIDFGQWQDYARPGDEYDGYSNLTFALNDKVKFEFQMNLTYRESTVIQSPSTANGSNNNLLVVPTANPGNTFGFDVRPFNWRPFAGEGTVPSFIDDHGAFNRPFSFWVDRFKLGATYGFGDTSWTGETWASTQTSRTRIDDVQLSFSRLQAALNGTGGPSGNQYFNPFGSADPRSAAYTTARANSQSLVDWMFVKQMYESSRTEFWYLESIATGDLFALPAGSLKSAVGVQVRQEKLSTTASNLVLAGDAYDNLITDPPPQPTSTTSQVRSIFAELDVPVFSSLSMQLAARHEDFKDLGLATTKPKISLRYQPLESLAFRTSYGESFLAPTPAQVTFVAGNACAEVFAGTDPFGLSATGLIGARSCSTGNPNVKPEESKVFNLGVTFRPVDALDSLEVSLDFQNINYANRIITPLSQELVTRDFNRFLAANNTTAAAYNLLSLAGKTALASPWFSSGQNNTLIIRDTSYQITTLTRAPENTTTVDIDLFDFRAKYNLDMGTAGNVMFNWSTTYYTNYSYTDSTTSINPVKVQAVGKENAITGVAPPIPEFKHSLGINWNRGNQNASITTKYQSSVKFDYAGYSAALTGVPAPGTPGAPTKIKASTIVDLRYAYTFENLAHGDMSAAVGVNNALDWSPDALPLNGGFESRLNDPYGRTMYLELSYEFK